MKKTILTSFILFAFIFPSANPLLPGGGCGFIGPGIDVEPDTIWVNYGDSIGVSLTYSTYTIPPYDCGSCWTEAVHFKKVQGSWVGDSCGTCDSISYTLHDTGTYNFYVRGDCQGPVGLFEATGEITILYRSSTAINEIGNKNDFQIYPSISNGIYHIKSVVESELKKISIFDALGKVIFVSVVPISVSSEIDLSNFSNGIYLYAIEGNGEAIFRGKIIKE